MTVAHVIKKSLKCHRAHKSQPPVPVPRQIGPVSPHCCTVLPVRSLSGGLFPSCFRSKVMYVYIICTMHTACLPHHFTPLRSKYSPQHHVVMSICCRCIGTIVQDEIYNRSDSISEYVKDACPFRAEGDRYPSGFREQSSVAVTVDLYPVRMSVCTASLTVVSRFLGECRASVTAPPSSHMLDIFTVIPSYPTGCDLCS
jgi:hypothetical protein